MSNMSIYNYEPHPFGHYSTFIEMVIYGDDDETHDFQPPSHSVMLVPDEPYSLVAPCPLVAYRSLIMVYPEAGPFGGNLAEWEGAIGDALEASDKTINTLYCLMRQQYGAPSH